VDDFGGGQEYAVPPGQRPHDAAETRAVARLRELFRSNRDRVYFSRQLQVLFEDEFFHWVTSRALGDLLRSREVRTEDRPLSWGGFISLYWHRSYRYYKRSAADLVELVEEYSDPNIGGALGLQGEALILGGFASRQFLMQGKDTREFRGRRWTGSEHELDFIFERDGRAYGVEVKNTLAYIDYQELQVKMQLCRSLGVTPVFAVRMLPKSWIHELQQAQGFALILKHQLYPWSRRELARRVAKELGLPVDSPRSLAGGTMDRFERWHQASL
jgi:hypothetical protein